MIISMSHQDIYLFPVPQSVDCSLHPLCPPCHGLCLWWPVQASETFGNKTKTSRPRQITITTEGSVLHRSQLSRYFITLPSLSSPFVSLFNTFLLLTRSKNTSEGEYTTITSSSKLWRCTASRAVSYFDFIFRSGITASIIGFWQWSWNKSSTCQLLFLAPDEVEKLLTWMKILVRNNLNSLRIINSENGIMMELMCFPQAVMFSMAVPPSRTRVHSLNTKLNVYNLKPLRSWGNWPSLVPVGPAWALTRSSDGVLAGAAPAW